VTAPDPLVATLVARRKALRLSQQAVADQLGVAREWLSRVENGHVDPRVSTVIAYAHAVGGSLEVDAHRPMPGDDADRLVALAAHLVDRGRCLLDEGVALRHRALAEMPVGTVLRWQLGSHRVPDGDVTKVDAGWVATGDGVPAMDEWVAEQWARGNLHRVLPAAGAVAS
jgi:transcriptional regulator with XRE-family HTH domain